MRACLCHDTYSAHQGVEHDDMNVLVPRGPSIGTEMAHELVRSVHCAEFSGEERHRRRLAKVKALEDRYWLHGRKPITRPFPDVGFC